MNVLDSCLWLEYFSGNNKLDALIKNAILDKNNLIVPSVCIYEVYKQTIVKINRERADLFYDLMQSGATVVNLDDELAVLAAKFGKEYKLPMADSIIYATALKYNAVVWTQDKHFDGLDSVRYFPKN